MMTDERLASIRQYAVSTLLDKSDSPICELLDEVSRLRSLAGQTPKDVIVRAPGDVKVQGAIKWLREWKFFMDDEIADMLESLTASLSSAELERDKARSDALEEAAKACDTFAANTLAMYQNGNKKCWFEHCAAQALAKAIRALKPPLPMPRRPNR